MAEVLALPFRITKNGEASKTVQGTEQYFSDQIATILLTIQKERLLEPSLGMPDIAFDGFKQSSFHTQVAKYLPELKNVVATTKMSDSTTQKVQVTFEIGAGI